MTRRRKNMCLKLAQKGESLNKGTAGKSTQVDKQQEFSGDRQGSKHHAPRIILSPCISKCSPASLSATQASSMIDTASTSNKNSPQRLCEDNPTHKIDCVEHIILREQYLTDIHIRSSKLDKYFRELHHCTQQLVTPLALPQKSKLWRLLEADLIELLSLLDQIRSVSLHIVQAAVKWRLTKQVSSEDSEDSGRQNIGFIYQGKNYLSKMRSDLIFLGDSPTMQYYIGHRISRTNLLVLPSVDTTLDEAHLTALDQVNLESRHE
mmetsp:Transcript_33835/g.103829  ORF Transcript_33835/g.103829 Transcript_33835/m.103829 type:complete len:264 (-) Transcript_33835:1552-2343(-)